MPFPWKKNRVTRISQIVADLQFQSPKRGRSLVVETGFPTSLIDLFVKNRSRFKKPRFKKPVRSEIPDPPPPPPSPATSPPPLTEPLIPDSPPAESQRPSPLTGENTDDAADPCWVSEPGSSSGAKTVIVKMLTVVVLVAMVKGFTVGITVSAFALLFLECAGKRVVSYLRPCSDAIGALESVFRRFQKVLFQQQAKEKCEPATVQSGGVESELSLNLNSPNIDEIEVVDAKSGLGVCCELDDYDYDSPSGNTMWGCEGKVVDPLVSDCKIRGSRSGRFKSKMVKKLMKFRSSKKEKKESKSESEVSSVVEEGKLSSFEIEEVLEDVGKEEVECVRDDEVECVRDDEVECGITCSQESELGRVGNSGYTILVVIALFGLIVGRLPALMLTIVWCFLLKILRALWRSQNVTPIKCSVPNS